MSFATKKKEILHLIYINMDGFGCYHVKCDESDPNTTHFY